MPAAGVLFRTKVLGKAVVASDLLGSGGVTVTGNGTWTMVAGVFPLSIDIRTTGGNIKIFGSNGTLVTGQTGGLAYQWSAPAAATNGVQLGSTATGKQIFELNAPVVYIKAQRATAANGGTTTARMFGREYGS